MRYSTVLDTGFGSSFLDNIGVQDGSTRIKIVADTIALVTSVGNRASATVMFHVVERLGVDFILGCNFSVTLVEAFPLRL